MSLTSNVADLLIDAQLQKVRYKPKSREYREWAMIEATLIMCEEMKGLRQDVRTSRMGRGHVTRFQSRF